MELGSAGGVIVGTVHEAMEIVAEFGGHNPLGAVAAAQVIADQPFRQMIAVTFGGVDEVDAAGHGLIQDLVDLWL